MGWITSPIELAGAAAARAEQRPEKEVAAERIAGRVLRAAQAGYIHMGVRGGFFGLIGTTHDPEIYADVADRLRGEGVEFEAHRMRETVGVSLGVESMAAPLSRHIDFDVIKVMSVGGQAVERAQASDQPPEYTRTMHVARLYPPQADPSDMHNQSFEA